MSKCGVYEVDYGTVLAAMKPAYNLDKPLDVHVLRDYAGRNVEVPIRSFDSQRFYDMVVKGQRSLEQSSVSVTLSMTYLNDPVGTNSTIDANVHHIEYISVMGGSTLTPILDEFGGGYTIPEKFGTFVYTEGFFHGLNKDAMLASMDGMSDSAKADAVSVCNAWTARNTHLEFNGEKLNEAEFKAKMECIYNEAVEKALAAKQAQLDDTITPKTEEKSSSMWWILAIAAYFILKKDDKKVEVNLDLGSTVSEERESLSDNVLY